jgi:photosystem II stability/assembly factor-like uncharacterized protein
MNINYKKLLPKILQDNRWGEYAEAIQEVLEEIKEDKIDIIKLRYYIENMSEEDIITIAEELGYTIPYYTGYTSQREYLLRQLLTIIPRIQYRNCDDGYQKIAFIYNLIAFAVPTYSDVYRLTPILDWDTFDEVEGAEYELDRGGDNALYVYIDGGGVEHYIYDTVKNDGYGELYSDTFPFVALDQDDIVGSITRHILFSYQFRGVESATEFISENTCKAMYYDIKNHKRRTEVIYFEPYMEFNTEIPTDDVEYEDAIEWQPTTTPLGTNLGKPAYGEDVWIIGEISDLASSTACYRSTDNGETWTSISLPEAGSWFSCAYGNGFFILTDNYDGKILRSSDLGLTWSLVETLSVSIQDIIFESNVFLIVSSTSYGVYRSEDDGDTWNLVLIGESNLWHWIFSADGILIVTSVGDTMSGEVHQSAWSDDLGLTWNLTVMPEVSQWFRGAYGDGRCFVPCADGVTCRGAYSDDYGQTWTATNFIDITQMISGVAFGDGFWVLVPPGSLYGSTETAYSTDNGGTWITETCPVDEIFWSCVFGGHRFISGSLYGTTSIMYAITGTPTPSDDYTTETYYTWDKEISAESHSIIYPYTSSGGILNYDLSSAHIIRFGDSSWGTSYISSATITDVNNYKFYLEIPLSGTLTSGDLIHAVEVINKEATELEIRKYILQKSKYVEPFSEIAIWDINNKCIYYSEFPLVNFSDSMYRNVALKINLL